MTARIAHPLYRSLTKAGRKSPTEARKALIAALERMATGEIRCTEPAESEIARLLHGGDLTWVVSEVYWRLLRDESKVPSGLVFTPPEVAACVINNLEDGIPVVDLGAGTGMLSIAAAKQGFLVTAIEREPELMHILACLASIEGVEDKVSVCLGDALSFEGSHPSQIMSNPPYSRHHSLSKQEKTRLTKLSAELGLRLPGTAGHYAYFMLYAWQASWSQREVFLVPTNWLECKYGAPLRNYLAEEKKATISSASQANRKSIFRHVLTTGCILTTVDKLSSSSVFSGGTTDFSSTQVRVSQTMRIPSPVDGKESSILNGNPSTSSTLRLGDFLHIRRGIATGANELFVLSMDAGEPVDIPIDELVPIVRKLTINNGPVTSSFLWVPKSVPSQASLKRIRWGVEMSFHLRALCKARKPWWKIPIPDAPMYFLSYMGRRQPVILKNDRNLSNLNNIHGINPVQGVEKELVDRVLQWLDTPDGKQALLSRSRHYQGGLWKLEPGEMQLVDVPASLVRESIRVDFDRSLSANQR